MIVEKRDGGLWVDILWDDLSSKTQKQLLKLMGENGNFDVVPVASINVSSAKENSTERISAKSIGNGWIDGTVDDFRFQAKVYDTGSKFGIDNGRVSKLAVWNRQTSADLINYDRGWDKKPANDEQRALFQELLSYLEGLPPEERWDELS